MSKNLELAEALMILSRATEVVAKIMLKFDDFKDDTVLTTIGTSDETIDFATYQAWPLAEEVPSYEYRSRISANKVQLLHGQTILEHSAGPVEPISPYFTHIFGECQIDLLSDKFVGCKEPPNLRLINKSELKKEYDIGIAWESLMFTSPVEVLTLMKHRCKKIHVRFRPWSSRNGANLSPTCNKAFFHLVSPAHHEIANLVIRPLEVYEKMFNELGLIIEERKVNTIQVEPFFSTNDEIMKVIKERTWGQISTSQALRIMATDTIDYVLR